MSELFICENCGPISVVWVDGYGFGDRLLEDVTFVVEDVAGSPKCQGVVPEDQEYFETLNKDLWIRECEEYCTSDDVATCPECDGNVAIRGYDYAAE